MVASSVVFVIEDFMFIVFVGVKERSLTLPFIDDRPVMTRDYVEPLNPQPRGGNAVPIPWGLTKHGGGETGVGRSRG